MEQQEKFDLEALKREMEELKHEGIALREVLLYAPPDKGTPEWDALVTRTATHALRQAKILAVLLDRLRSTDGLK